MKAIDKPGCTDSTACNYDSEAKTNDDSCEFYDDDGYHCGDMQVLQDIIDINESFSGLEPLDLGAYFDSSGRLTEFLLERDRALSEGVISYTDDFVNYLPQSIGNLTELKNVSLQETDLTSIPETFGDLINLRDIYIRNNYQLTTLPSSLCNIPNPRIFIVSGNCLSEEYHYDCIIGWGTQNNDNCD